ncbi:AF4/FMR2 family member 4-like [Limulus polyphemus]|uniref:AF4/FMR2 family member lilli n=1 Tax=Limulus polyphemus TaxID=6850 RepID=A0ABM1SZ53_LIMPO|nr:AF4/FMR2 family member 4-like [Limulus polyphemus]
MMLHDINHSKNVPPGPLCKVLCMCQQSEETLQLCLDHRDWTVDQWKCVMSSDEPHYSAVMIDPNKEDETSRRVKQTLGDFTHVQQYLTQDPKHLIGISLTAAALSSQLCPTPDTSSNFGGSNNNQQHANSPKVHTCNSNDSATVSSSVTSTAGSQFVVKKEIQHPKKTQISNGQYKDDPTVGCQKSPVTGEQVKEVTVKKPQLVLSQCVTSDLQPKLITVPRIEKELESMVVSNKEAVYDSQPVSVKAGDEQLHEKTNNPFHETFNRNGSIHLANQNKSSRDDGILRKVNVQQGETCVKSHAEVEHILKEMKEPVPPPLTAIETPRKEEPEFRFFHFKEKPEVGALENSSVQEKGDTVEKPRDRNKSTSFNFHGDLDVSDSENEMVTFQGKEDVKLNLNSRLSENGNHCPATPSRRESSSSDSSSSSSEDSTSDSEDSDSSASSEDSVTEMEQKPETQSWRLANFVDKDASSPLIPFGNLSTGGEQNQKSQISTNQISDQDSLSNTPIEGSNEAHRSSSAELRIAAGLGNTEVRILLSPVHLPPGFQPDDSMFIDNPFSSYSKQWEDDVKMGSNWSEIIGNEKRVCPSQPKKVIHPSLKQTDNVEELNSVVDPLKRSPAQKLISTKKDSIESFLASPTLANKSEHQSDDICAFKGHDLIKKTLSSQPRDGDVKHNVGKKKERTLPSTNSALQKSRSKEENKSVYLKTSKEEVKHKRDLIRNSTPKLPVNDSEKPTSSSCPNSENSEKTTQKLTSKYVSDTPNIDESTDNVERITSPVKVQKTSKHLSTPSKSSISQKLRSSSPKQNTPPRKTVSKYKSGRSKEKPESSITSNVLKVIDSVAKHATVTSHLELENLDVDRAEVSQKNIHQNNIFERLELPFIQGNLSPLTETIFEFQSEKKPSTIPEILVSIKLDLINRIPSAPLQFQVNRTYSPLDSDIKVRTENVTQDITKENNVIKVLEVKKEDLKTTIDSDKACCTKDKSINTSKLKPSDKDKVRTVKRKAPEETRLEGKKKKASSDTVSIVSVPEVDNMERLTMKESKKLDDNSKMLSSERCESPSSFSVCSVSSQHSVKSSQETSLTSKPSGNKTKDKVLKKVKQKLKDENKSKSKTPTPSHVFEKDASLGSNKKEPEEKKQAKEKKEKEYTNKDKERSRVKDKEQDHGCSDSKRPRKSAIVEKSLSSSSQVGKPTTEKPYSNLKRDHEQRLQGSKKEVTPNSYSELEHTVPDQLATNRLRIASEDQDTRQSSPDYYLNEAKNLKHQADREVDITVQAIKYLEAVYFFILTGNAMEHSHVECERVYKMYKETLDLIRCIWSKFQKMQQNTCNLDKRITVLSLRCQSLLDLKFIILCCLVYDVSPYCT